MKKIAFILSMPNVGSWDSQWTGEGNLYAVVKTYSDCYWKKIKDKGGKGGYYNFGDGWRASVDVKEVSTLEARQIKKRSNGFLGYEWMIDSLINFSKIYNSQERKKRLTAV